MNDVANMGTPKDMMDRTSLARQDTDANRLRVHNARQLIFQKNISVDASAVDAHLADGSLVPINVSQTLAQAPPIS